VKCDFNFIKFPSLLKSIQFLASHHTAKLKNLSAQHIGKIVFRVDRVFFARLAAALEFSTAGGPLSGELRAAWRALFNFVAGQQRYSNIAIGTQLLLIMRSRPKMKSADADYTTSDGCSIFLLFIPRINTHTRRGKLNSSTRIVRTCRNMGINFLFTKKICYLTIASFLRKTIKYKNMIKGGIFWKLKKKFIPTLQSDASFNSADGVA
jgi:hypothetical protein